MMVFDITKVESFENIADIWLPKVTPTHHTGVSCELNRVTDQLNKLSYSN